MRSLLDLAIDATESRFNGGNGAPVIVSENHSGYNPNSCHALDSVRGKVSLMVAVPGTFTFNWPELANVLAPP